MASRTVASGKSLEFCHRMCREYQMQRCSKKRLTLLAATFSEKKWLQLFGKVLRADNQHPLRLACFVPYTLLPVTDQYVRRVWHPSKEWVREFIQESSALFGNWCRPTSQRRTSNPGMLYLQRSLDFDLTCRPIFSFFIFLF